MAPEPTLTVLFMQSPAPRVVQTRTLILPPGSTVADALRAAGQALPYPGPEALPAGRVEGLSVWGRRVDLQHVLREGDRLELTRPLRVDPKVARRERFARQGSRAAGLFQQRRPGAKAGY